jgi:hypothetical protein
MIEQPIRDWRMERSNPPTGSKAMLKTETDLF